MRPAKSFRIMVRQKALRNTFFGVSEIYVSLISIQSIFHVRHREHYLKKRDRALSHGFVISYRNRPDFAALLLKNDPTGMSIKSMRAIASEPKSNS